MSEKRGNDRNGGGSGVGRTRTISARLILEIAKWLRQDVSFEAACGACGVTESTGFRWLRRGRLEFVNREEGIPARPEENIYAEFFKEVRRAQGLAECEDIEHIRKGQGKWQSRAWIQSRRYAAKLTREEIKRIETDSPGEYRNGELEEGRGEEEDEIVPDIFQMPDGALLAAKDVPGYEFGSYKKADGSPCERDEAEVEVWKNSHPGEQKALTAGG
jgi:hypothetical protein